VKRNLKLKVKVKLLRKERLQRKEKKLVVEKLK